MTIILHDTEYLTVAELIEQLRKLPPDAPVVLFDSENGYSEVTGVKYPSEMVIEGKHKGNPYVDDEVKKDTQILVAEIEG